MADNNTNTDQKPSRVKLEGNYAVSTADFEQLGRTNRKSIVALAKSNIFEFPVFMSDTVRKDFVDPANCLLEQVYMSYMQMAFSVSQVVDASSLQSGQPFKKFKTDTNKYIEYTDMTYAHDACHNVIETDGYIVECEMVSLPDNINRVITEYCAHDPLSEFNHYFQEADDNNDNTNNDDSNNDNTNNDRNPNEFSGVDTAGRSSYQTTQVRRDIFDDDDDRRIGTAITTRPSEMDMMITRDNLVHGRKAELRAREKHNFDVKIKSAQLVDESKIQKLNTLKPLMMTVNFRVKNGNSGVSGPIEYVVGIKTHTRLIDATVLPEMAKYPLKEMNKLSRKAKWRAGEINFFEYLFNTKSKKQTAIDSSDPKRKWYRRLYELAHSGNDLVAQQSLTGQRLLNRLDLRSRYNAEKNNITLTSNAIINEFDGVMPNVTLVISMDDVNNVKRETEMDLLKPSTAIKLCKEMFMIGIIVIDSDEETLKMLLPDIHNDYEIHSLAALNRQLATLDTSGVSAADISKILGRNR